MKTRLFALCALILALGGLQQPRGAAVSPPGQAITSQQARQRTADWTVLVYMSADNDLERYFAGDLNEMERVGSTEAINVVVQVDRAEGFDAREGDWTEARRLFVRRDASIFTLSSEVVAALGEVNMGDAATLQDFVTWAIQTYPARRYALIFWNHGAGWQGWITTCRQTTTG